MWKQYTRETPARPGWAVAGMVLAFAATLGLAQWTIGHRQLSLRQELKGWPIAFTLPASLNWSQAKGREAYHYIKGTYEATYIGHHSELGHCLFIVVCEPEAEPAGFAEILRRHARVLTGESEPIRVGPLEGMLTRAVGDHDQRMVYVEATSPDRLEMNLFVIADWREADLKKVIREAAESIEILATKPGRP